MKGHCTKCGKITEFVEKESCARAGDRGYTPAKAMVCAECGFSPLFFKPTV